MFKIVNDLVDIPAQYKPVLRQPQPRRGNQQQFKRFSAEVDSFKYSFLPRTVVDWNNQSAQVVAADSLESFKRRLDCL